MNLDKGTLLRMVGAGIRFTVDIFAPGGSHEVTLKIEDTTLYISDATAFAAKHFGLTKQQYLEWLELDGYARCGATTVSGNRCKNLVSGMGQLPADAWLRRDGQYCATHGGWTSEEVRS